MIDKNRWKLDRLIDRQGDKERKKETVIVRKKER